MTQSNAITAQSSSTGAAVTSAKLLHLGCGLTAPAEWVNVDGSFNAWLAQRRVLRKIVTSLHLVSRSKTDISWPTNVVIADLRKRLPFPDASFDAVYSSHVLEHLYRNEALATLKEAHRVLKPGGRCRNMVPDVEHLVAQYTQHSSNDPARDLMGSLLMRHENRDHHGLIYGIYRNMTDFHFHKWMYDGKSMVRLMEEAGFKDCRTRQYLQSEIAHIDKVEMPDRANGAVIVEGQKA